MLLPKDLCQGAVSAIERLRTAFPSELGSDGLVAITGVQAELIP